MIIGMVGPTSLIILLGIISLIIIAIKKIKNKFKNKFNKNN